jgi:hypothetical protein
MGNTSGFIVAGLALTALIALIAGCATEPTPLDEDFGESVRQMVAVQKYESPDLPPPTASDPPPDLLGMKGEEAMKTYKGESKKQEVSRPIIIDMGGDASGSR